MSLAILASFILVSGLITSFLTQSTITYESRSVLKHTEVPSAPFAQSFPPRLKDGVTIGKEVISTSSGVIVLV